jgi:hypothetical protein
MNTMRNFYPFLFVIILLITGCNAQEVFVANNIHARWATPSSFSIPESVKHYPEDSVLFVSNINGDPDKKDGNGFISKLSYDGKISVLKWVQGLDAPKGMAVWENHLFVTNINEIAEIEIAGGKIVNRYPVADASFLNDIDIDTNGVLYISDTWKGKVFRMVDGKTEDWLDGPQFEGVNGIYCKGDNLYVGTKNSILQVNTISKAISVFADTTGGIDGLKSFDENTFLFSDWQGSVYSVSRNGKRELLLNTSLAKINAADIEYIPDNHLLLVPTFFDNRVMAYEIE